MKPLLYSLLLPAIFSFGIAQAQEALKVYQNYDFVPGTRILFEDHFEGDADGEFPAHFELLKGQAVINKVSGEPALLLTDGNYARVRPRMKKPHYLDSAYTIEFDYYPLPGGYSLLAMLSYFDKEAGYDQEHSFEVTSSEARFNDGGAGLSKALPAELAATFDNHWHHIAIAYRNRQVKLYIDQYRLLVVPDTRATYKSLEMGGIGSETTPLTFRNLRIAAGGGMNMVGKKFTDSKIIAYGINFDTDKATLRPESMGTLNRIVQLLTENPELRFEIGGHTDNSGSAAHNLELSKQRAEAVRAQLIAMGIAENRLTSKGFGDSKPLDNNTTLEGKANNRRVEFTRL